MTKDVIAFYTKDRIPLSLSNLMLKKPFVLEDIFDAVEDAEDFSELTAILQTIISDKVTVDRQTERYIRYIITDCFGNKDYLKIKVKTA